MTASPITIRPASERDERDLERLAELDSQRPLTGDVLLAEMDGTPVAAMSVDEGRTTADPFVPTATTVQMLRARATQLRTPAPEPGHRHLLHSRVAA
jgi:hypothetical protein